MRSYRHRAKRLLGLPSVTWAHPGAVSVLQRWDSALRLDPHPHTLAIDGVYVQSPSSSRPEFFMLPEPSQDDLYDLATRISRKVEKVLEKHGRDDVHSSSEQEQTVLGTCMSASAQGMDLLGDRPGRPTQCLRVVPPVPPTHAKPLPLVDVDGFNIHAARTVHEHDRNGLLRLARYIARPPIANERLHIEPDGRLRYDMKRTWSDGTSAIVLSPLDFISRLCALIPPPYFNLTRYHGVLAAGALHRGEVVPCVTLPERSPQQLWLPGLAPGPGEDVEGSRGRERRSGGRHPWAELLRRTFRVDVETCSRCGSAMRLLELCTEPRSIERALVREGLGPMPPPRRVSRERRGQQELEL